MAMGQGQRWGTVVVLVLVAAAGLWMTTVVVDSFFNRQALKTLERNRVCTSDGAPEHCSGSKGIQFKKFLWFVTDGLPISHSERIMHWYREHMQLYPIHVPGAKYSHAIYTSWLTGELPTNYHGAAIEGDQLLERLVEAGHSMRYVGPEWSFLAISGKKNYERLLTGGTELHHEALDSSVKHSYPFFFANKTATRKLQFETWPELMYLNQSLIAHSGVFDHLNHGVFRYDGDPKVLNEAAAVVGNDLKILKAMVDANPEYLLIFSADHGVDAITSSGYVLHGETEGGNEGYLLMYNPLLEPYKSPKIDVVDVAPTLAKYLGADIPFATVGMPRRQFHNDQEGIVEQSNVLKESITQLDRGARARGKDGLPLAQLEALLDLEPSQSNLELLRRSALGLKKELYEVMDAPKGRVYLFACVGVAFLICHMVLSNYRWAVRLLSQGEVRRTVVYCVSLGLVYFAPLVHLLFATDIYGTVFRKGTTFFLPSSLLALLIMFLWQRQAMFKRKIRRLRRGTAAELAPRCDHSVLFSQLGVTLLACSELISWLVLALTLILGARWKVYFSSLSQATNISYACAFTLFLVCRCLQLSQEGRKKGTVLATVLDTHTWAVASALVAFRWYETTAADPSYYENFEGFHDCIVVGGVLGSVYLTAAALWKRSIGSATVAISLVLFVLWMDSNSSRMLNLLWSMVLVFCHGPQFEAIVHHVKALDTCMNGGTVVGREDPLHAAPLKRAQTAAAHQAAEASVLLQAIAVLLVNSSFYHLTVTLGDAVTMDVHPFAGRVGMLNWDAHPILSGFLMCFHKYGYLTVFVLYISWLCTRGATGHLFPASFLSPLSQRLESSVLQRYQRAATKYGSVPLYWREGTRVQTIAQTTLLGVCLLYAVVAGAGYHLLLFNYSPQHAIEESAVYGALWGLISGCLFLFVAVEGYLLQSGQPATQNDKTSGITMHQS